MFIILNITFCTENTRSFVSRHLSHSIVGGLQMPHAIVGWALRLCASSALTAVHVSASRSRSARGRGYERRGAMDPRSAIFPVIRHLSFILFIEAFYYSSVFEDVM